MTSLNRRQFLIGSLSLGSSALLLSGCAVSESDETHPSARIAVVLDESASFQQNLPTAQAIVARYIRENAVAGESEVYLFAMDREPRQLEYYPAEAMLDARSNEVLEKMKATHPLNGTDVVGALRLALEKLHKDTGVQPGKRVLLVFSDLHVDQSTPPAKELFEPLEAFAWAELQDVESHFYFVAQKNEEIVSNLLRQGGTSGQVLDAQESRRLVLQDEVEKQ